MLFLINRFGIGMMLYNFNLKRFDLTKGLIFDTSLITRGTDGSPHGGTPARESHARPDGCGGHHLRFCGNG